MATPLITSARMAQQRARRQNILRTTEFGDSFNPSRSAATPATVRVAKVRPPTGGKPAVNVAVRLPVSSPPPVNSLYAANGKLTRRAMQDCRHNNCRGMTDLVDDNHSIPHSNLG